MGRATFSEKPVVAATEVGAKKDFQKKYKTPRKAARSRCAFL
jgi:hypothetical protein